MLCGKNAMGALDAAIDFCLCDSYIDENKFLYSIFILIGVFCKS